VWADAYPIVRACGHYAVPLPVPETIAAVWLARQAGSALPDGVPGLIPGTLDAGAANADGMILDAAVIPWGRRADYLIGIADRQGKAELLIASPAGAAIERAANLGLDPRDTVTGTGLAIEARYALDLPADAVHWLGAMLRAAQIAGAGAACLELAVNYAGEREQFGRTLSRFQAIQHHLADLAGTMASADAMAAAAFAAFDRSGISGHGRNARFEIAAAKCRASEAVERLAGLSHQVHGAIGFTYEYGLHFLTRRLWAWRAEFGGAGEWGEYLGAVAFESGGDAIWQVITG
jgi:acyl-CoA dehydrogenase